MVMKWMELECGTWLLAERQKRVNTFFYFPNFLFVPVVNSPAALPAKAGESAPFSRTCNSVSILFLRFPSEGGTRCLQRVGKEMRLCRLIFAPSATPFVIVFGEANPPLIRLGLAVQKSVVCAAGTAASTDVVTMLLLFRGSSPRDESVRRRTFGVRTRPRVAFRSGPRRFSAPRPQKASGLLIRSILNEYTDFTKLDRALVS